MLKSMGRESSMFPRYSSCLLEPNANRNTSYDKKKLINKPWDGVNP